MHYKTEMYRINKVILSIKSPLWYNFGDLLLQERLGEFGGHEEFRSGRDEQHLSNNTQKSGQAELAESGH